MEKLCQIQAGKYLLAVKRSAILQTVEINRFLSEEQDAERSLILLVSLFDQHSGALLEPEGVVMEVKSTNGSQLLVIDRISEKSITSDHIESLPLLYPDLTRLCCPQIVIHKEQPLLLLDFEGLETVLALQKNEFATLSTATLRRYCGSETEVEDMQSAAPFDAATFNTIVSWAMAEFLKRGNDTRGAIFPDEKLLETISSKDAPSVDEDLLQELIDKTIQKCRKFHDNAMERLKQTSALVKS